MLLPCQRRQLLRSHLTSLSPPCPLLPALQIVALSAREGLSLLPLIGGAPAPAAAADSKAKAAGAAPHAALPGLQPLHYQLEALLFRAGARPRRPDWRDWQAGWLAAQRRRGAR